MEIRLNNTDKHEMFDNYKRYQTVITDLIVGDRVTLMINGKVIFEQSVIYGDATVSTVLQDRGKLLAVLTDEELKQAIEDFRVKTQ